jgi:hypothetical protein
VLLVVWFEDGKEVLFQMVKLNIEIDELIQVGNKKSNGITD